jgi:ribulose-phosphate 3-epimerase
MEPFLIAPSILAADFACLGQSCEDVLQAGADMIHFDVMDNHYVPNLTVGPMVCKALRDYGVTAPIDVHLMVSPVDAMITAFAKAGASMICFHPEASQHVSRSLSLIQELGCQAGIALNPATPLHHLDHVMDQVDMVLVMTVNPGFGGQAFMRSMLPKIEAVRQRIVASGRPIRLQVDGGIQASNIAEVAKAGADVFVAGSAIFQRDDYTQAIDEMRAALTPVTMKTC